jgi:kinesin family protein 6/9
VLGGLINNQKEAYRFPFSNILGMDVSQEDVFESIGRPLVDSAMQGYNGTIFAYGQTGSGKTFSITGGAENYEDRGLIPRTLAAIFEDIKKRTDQQFVVRISYLEIYNDSGYDLLDPSHDSKKLEDLPKVVMHSDDDGNFRMSNIGQIQVDSMEDALNLLFIGDTNRVICETPMNDQSSRSHCIFTIKYVSAISC